MWAAPGATIRTPVAPATCRQFAIPTTSFIHIFGKGRKERDIPIWKNTAKTLSRWFRELEDQTQFAFPNARGGQLSRNGVNYLLKQVVDEAIKTCPSLKGKSITAHTFRHSTALHLLQSGVSISVIALWLGHESIETTHIYMEADLAAKEKALQKLSPAGADTPRFKPTDEVISFLGTL